MKGKKNKIVGREEEQRVLKNALDSNRSEFIALYGRRRVGKTFLVKNLFESLDCTFIYTSGMKDGVLKQQIANFIESVERGLFNGKDMLKSPSTWMESFKLLTNVLEKHNLGKKVVLFIDELPWLATKKSKCLQAIDYYWNRHWSHNPDFKLIVCGSAASWIIKNIIKNKGGLYNRITHQFRLDPFKLHDASAFLKSKGIRLSNKQILEIYFATGGIPYYLNQIEKKESAAQAVARIAFSKNGVLYNDFEILFDSLFDNAEVYVEIVKILAQHRYGIEQEELFKQVTNLKKGGYATSIIKNLEDTGFIISFVPYGNKKRGTYLRIIDEYISFYLKWIEPIRESSQKLSYAHKNWLSKRNSPSWRAWSGYAFEAICYKHVNRIHDALDIDYSAVACTWRHDGKSGDQGAQIDLLFDRQDGAITVCEIKYTDSPFKIDRSYYHELERKIDVFREISKTKKEIFLALITSSGLKSSIYSEEYVSGVVTLDHLFV